MSQSQTRAFDNDFFSEPLAGRVPPHDASHVTPRKPSPEAGPPVGPTLVRAPSGGPELARGMSGGPELAQGPSGGPEFAQGPSGGPEGARTATPPTEAPTEAPTAKDVNAWAPPAQFEDYVLVRQLGRGAMGVVYLAEDRLLARHVAIKFILTAAAGGEGGREHFLNEARAVARVPHPNVISIYRVGEIEGRPYLVTEFARGQSLERLPVPMPWEKALEIGVDLARGLAAAHRRGLLHCDIKPMNAILTPEGAKLVDFGLARLTAGRFEDLRASRAEKPPESEAPTGTREKFIRGTPHFMAPELWRGEPPSKRSDVYALGALLYYLAAGRCPFEEVPDTELWRHVHVHDPPSLREIAPGVDARLVAIIERCLLSNQSDRFGSGDELREALEQLARRAAGAPSPPGNPYRGLRAFEADHRAFFFGRDAEAGVLLDRLRVESFLVVTGDSGVGKSSLCRASILPAVREGTLGGGRSWSVLTFTPGKRPLTALATAVATLLRLDPTRLARLARQDRFAIADALGRHLGDGKGLLLFVDQTEELVTVSEPGERDAADAALAELAAGRPGLRVLTTLRADFLTRFAALPRLGEDLSRVIYFLRPLGPERMRDVIVGPAAVAGLRFESDAMVDELVGATANVGGGGLPLLQFALAELWEARDQKASVIPRSALHAIGGVGGALAKHADALILTLPPTQRAEARRALTHLVTLEDTRVRRTGAELGAERPDARAALNALVRGRLLVAHEDEAGGSFELAHEVLVREWGTLRRWLAEDVEKRAVRERLTAAAAEWDRAGRRKDTLWNARQLREAEALQPDELSAIESEFLDDSAQSVRRTRWLRAGALVGVPLLIAAAYGGALASSRHDLARRVDELVAQDRALLAAARAKRTEADALRAEAFRRFDAGERPRGEELWASSLERTAAAERDLAEAGRGFESAFAQDPSRADVRSLLGQTLYERALLAEASGEARQATELAQRFVLYDPNGELARRWDAPALVSLSGTPGARARLERADAQPPPAPRDLGALPIAATQLERGSYVLTLSAPGRATVRYPLLVTRGEQLALSINLPLANDVPAGFAFVPPGRFLFGAAGDEQARRGFFDTVPQHEVRTGGYLIGRTEVTYADWIPFLDSLPPAERARRAPGTGAKQGLNGTMQLTPAPGGGWALTYQPLETAYRARANEPIVYAGRKEHARHNWLKFPVTGISADDALAYAAWLDQTGRLRGARLCTEHEWERAARGADGRIYPHGDKLAPGDVNIDEAYGRQNMGLDEVASHPASQSPFGLYDMSGNAIEWVRSSLAQGEFVVRGGSYFHDQKTAESINRAVAPSSLRDIVGGLRLCADFPRAR
jgi:eukaryotic-like serine/threonine-protein kinase